MAYLVDGAVAVGVPRPFGGEHPRRKLVVVHIEVGGACRGAMCVHARARGRVPDEGGRREVRPGASMEKKARNLLSVTGGPLAWRARLCEARAGGVSNERLGCSRRRFLVLLQCHAKPAARRVKCGARSRNSPRLPLALTPDVTTRKVEARDSARACVFGSSRARRRPTFASPRAERTQKSGVTFRMGIQSRARERMRNERALTGALPLTGALERVAVYGKLFRVPDRHERTPQKSRLGR